MSVSMPAEPVPLIGMVSSFSVRNTARIIVRTSSITCRKAGSRWPRVGRAIAFSTLASTTDGPGPISTREGGTREGKGALMRRR